MIDNGDEILVGTGRDGSLMLLLGWVVIVGYLGR